MEDKSIQKTDRSRRTLVSFLGRLFCTGRNRQARTNTGKKLHHPRRDCIYIRGCRTAEEGLHVWPMEQFVVEPDFFYPACYGIGFLSQPIERQGGAGVSGTDEKPGRSGAAGGAKPID